jgi:hypothetical protein
MFIVLLSICILPLVPTRGAVQKRDAVASVEGQILWRFDTGG